MKIDAKPFKTWDEEIKIINQWGNGFLNKNPSKGKKLFKYLKRYGFQTCVKPFVPLLWKDFNDGISGKNLKFIDNFQLDDLFALFKFDTRLKSVIGDLLQELEKRLREGIVYQTLEYLKYVCKNNINLPFLLVDDEWAPKIAKAIFSNNISKQSFFTANNDFKYNEYYSFLQKYIEPFEMGSLFIKNAHINKFYFCNILSNYNKLKSERNFDQYKTFTKILNSKLNPLEITDWEGHKIACTYFHFFKWCKQIKRVPNEFKDDESYIDVSTTDGMINVLAKSFIPMYKSFTQESFGDLVKFFIKLNENIQLKIIKEHFSIFYLKIKEINNDKENFNFILISSFISFLNLFKNMRNKTAHISIIYNFWQIDVHNNSSLSRTTKTRDDDFWIANQATCTFLNILIDKENNDFLSNYFKANYLGKKTNYYLDELNFILIKVYCKYKNNQIYYVHKNDNDKVWSLPMFFLKDAIDWLLIFLDKKADAAKLLEKLIIKSNFSSKEIRNWLHDYLFNKIIISLEKIHHDK